MRRIGLGTMPLAIAGRPSIEDATRLIRRALDGGINWFDTADSYALDDADIGYGERLLARALAEAKAEVVEMQARLTALKVALPPGEGPVLRRAREHIDSTTAQVTPEQLEAFQRVEDHRYAVFMPPPAAWE